LGRDVIRRRRALGRRLQRDPASLTVGELEELTVDELEVAGRRVLAAADRDRLSAELLARLRLIEPAPFGQNRFGVRALHYLARHCASFPPADQRYIAWVLGARHMSDSDRRAHLRDVRLGLVCGLRGDAAALSTEELGVLADDDVQPLYSQVLSSLDHAILLAELVRRFLGTGLVPHPIVGAVEGTGHAGVPNAGLRYLATHGAALPAETTVAVVREQAARLRELSRRSPPGSNRLRDASRPAGSPDR
jgi:hypothetical protein